MFKSHLLLVFFFISLLNFSQNSSDEVYIKYRDSLIEKGRRAYFQKNLPALIKTTNNVKFLYLKEKDSILLAKYYHFKALQNKLVYKNDSAFYYYHESKKISKEINDSLEVGRRLLSIAVLQKNIKDFLGSEVSSVEALQYLEPLKAYKYIERTYNNLGTVSNQLNQKEEALKYYNKALEFNKLQDNLSGYLHIINNIGLLYQQKRDHKKANKFFSLGLKLDSIKQKYPLRYALLLENYTFSSYELGEDSLTEESFKEVLSIRKGLKEINELATVHLNLANYYYKKNLFQKSKYHTKQALLYAKETHYNKRWLEALLSLSELSTGNESKAYLQEYITLNDSLFQQERQLKNQFAKIRYETTKKEKENQALKIENEKTLAEAEAQKQRATISLLISAVSIMFLLSGASFFRFRRRRILFQAQLQKVEAREEERRQIAKSLHDEVAGDLRLLHRKLEKSFLLEEAQKLELVKENVRNLSHQLSSTSFEEVPFKDQVINMVSDYFSPEFIIRVNGLKQIDWLQVNKAIKRMLYLSLRECIQNCQKYAAASRLTINFSIHKKTVFLEVVDNGKGFDTATQKKGIGLQNIQERVQELNGTLTIESEVGQGTHIIIQIPLNA